MRTRVGDDLLARELEKRAPQDFSAVARLGQHAARALEPRAAQEIHQNGLGLVVEMVCERDAVGIGAGEDLVARLARGRLEALPLSSYLHLVNPERHAEPAAKFATERRPGVGIRTQTVVDVQRRKSG